MNQAERMSVMDLRSYKVDYRPKLSASCNPMLPLQGRIVTVDMFVKYAYHCEQETTSAQQWVTLHNSMNPSYKKQYNDMQNVGSGALANQ